MPFPNLEGRPSSYTEDVPNKVGEYVSKCMEEKRLPTRAGLSNYIGITKKTLIDWGTKHEQLLHALHAFDQLQEDEVWDKALKGEYNSNIAKLMLHNHGYSDRVDTRNTNINTEIEEAKDKSVAEQINDILDELEDIKKFNE